MEPLDGIPQDLHQEANLAHSTTVDTSQADPGFSGYRRADDLPRHTLVPLRAWGLPTRPNPELDKVEAEGLVVVANPATKVPRLRAPEWLRGSYRPKALTSAGAFALNQLSPAGDGLNPFPRCRIANLEQRREYLAMRYVALDMLMRGLAFEVNGHFHHWEDLDHRSAIGNLAQMEMTPSNERMHELAMLSWLAICRMMSLDQVILLEPQNARNNVDLLWALEAKDLVTRFQVVHGLGRWDAYTLTDRTWRWMHHQYPELAKRGVGPRKLAGNNRDLHEALQVDALCWFIQDLTDAGGEVLDVWLDRALRREAYHGGGGGYRDFRLCSRNAKGLETIQEVEVIGVGSTYRTRGKREANRNCPVYCSYSAGGGRIEMGRHVSIGR